MNTEFAHAERRTGPYLYCLIKPHNMHGKTVWTGLTTKSLVRVAYFFTSTTSKVMLRVLRSSYEYYEYSWELIFTPGCEYS